MTTRRKFIMLAGGGVVLAAGGIAGWAITRNPAAARRPWQTAGRDRDDIRRFALSYAVLAPNPHNRQPWIADLSVAGEVALYCDLDRRLPATDPYDRQITIGLGAFSELLVMAAAQAGWRVDATFFPDSEPFPRLDERPVARFRFARDGAIEPDPLFAHVLVRRTNREAYDTGKPVAEETAAAIAAAARRAAGGHAVAQGKVAALRELAWKAMDTEMRTYDTARESVDLLRIGKAEIEANPDGIAIAGPLMEAATRLGLLSRRDMLDPETSLFRQQMEFMKPQFDTAAGFVWLVTAGNDRTDQIEAGRDYVRINLAATALGVAMQPMSQALQEYPEMKDHFAAIRRQLGVGEGDTLQMFSRIGYGPAIPAAPRWDYKTRIGGA